MAAIVCIIIQVPLRSARHERGRSVLPLCRSFPEIGGWRGGNGYVRQGERGGTAPANWVQPAPEPSPPSEPNSAEKAPLRSETKLQFLRKKLGEIQLPVDVWLPWLGN